MGTKIASLYAEIGADTTKLESGLRKTKTGLKDTKDNAENTGRSMKGFALNALAAAGAIATVASALKESIDAASDMSETVNKTQVVFGDAADEVINFGKDAAIGMGMSKQAALAAAATFGNLFVSMGLAEDKSADMSTSLVKLAGDLASFNNIDPTVALDKLRAGISGEAEPLRALGVNINEVAVQTKALELGLAATTKELTVADKAQARYALILEQTATAQGDFARTSDGLANQQRILEAQLADTSAELGNNLLPAYLELVKTANAAATAYNTLITAQDKINAALSEHEGNVRDSSASYKEYAAEIARSSQVAGYQVKVLEDGVHVYSVMHGALNDVTDDFNVLTEAQFESSKAAEEWNSDQREAMLVAKESGQAARDYASSVDRLAMAEEHASDMGWSMTYFLRENKKKLEEAAAAAKEYATQQENMSAATWNLVDAQKSFNENFGDTVVSKLDAAGIKGEAYEKALGLVDERLGTNKKAQYEANKELDAAIKKYQQTGDIKEFDKALDANKSKWEELDDSLVRAQAGFDAAKSKWNQFITSLKAADGLKITVNVSAIGGGGGGTAGNPGAQTTGGGGGRGRASGFQENFASGGSFIIGPGYPNDSYPLGPGKWAQTGEEVTVTPAGQSSGSNVTYNIFSREAPGQIMQAIRISQLSGGAA